MKRDAAPAPRVAATLLMGFIISVLSTTAFSWWAVGPLRLQPLVVMVVSAGFRLPLIPGGLVTLSLGYLADLASGGVSGLQITAYLLVLSVCAVAERKLEINSWPFQMLSAGAMSLLFQMVVVGGISLLARQPLHSPSLLWVLGAQAALTALTAPVFFGILEFMVTVFDHFWPHQSGQARK
jgi:cell shape-determining protein MreD